MKIAIIDIRLNLKTGGGSNHDLHLLASGLVNLGHEVMVISLNPSLDAYPDNLPYRVIPEGLNSSRFGRNVRLALQKVLHKYENQVDIYHLNHPDLSPGAAIYRQLGGKVPVVATLNNYYFCTDATRIDMNCIRHCGLLQRVWHRPQNIARKAALLPFHAFEYFLGTRLINRVDAFIAVSKPISEIFSLYHHIKQKKLTVIAPPIEYEYLYNRRENYSCRPSSTGLYNILYVGRLSSEKGVDTLIDAMTRLEFPAWLHIVGDGSQKNNLENLSKELSLSNRVTFHGWVPYDRVVSFYLDSQLFVHPAKWPEPMARTVLDAMALGVPIIAAGCGGPPWALQDTGLTFQPGDTEDLVEKIRLVHRNPSLAMDRAKRAQERAKDFDFRKAVLKLIEVYAGVIEEAKTRKT
jgi:glycosyltransferase involved in cell wall biosynthesis